MSEGGASAPAPDPLDEFLAGLRILTDRWNDRMGQLATSTKISPEYVPVLGVAPGRTPAVRRGPKTVVTVVLRDTRVKGESAD